MTDDATPTTLLGLLSQVPDERIAIVDPDHDVRVSYGALKQQVQAVAGSLVAAGVGRGDRVGIALPNGVRQHCQLSRRLNGWHRRAA